MYLINSFYRIMNNNVLSVFSINNNISSLFFLSRQEYGRALLYILRQQPLEEILKNIHDIISTLLMISEDEGELNDCGCVQVLGCMFDRQTNFIYLFL